MLRTSEATPQPPTWPSIAVASSQIGERDDASLLNLGTIFVAGDRVIVSGSLSREIAADSVLEINGKPTPLEESGAFCASTALTRERVLTLVVETAAHEVIALRIPLSVGGEP